MDFLQGMNAALDAIEADLRAPVDLKKLGRLAACSPFHFQRMFGCLAGISLSEYVRRRRMTLAAVALKDPRRRVLDVALEFGYDSPTAFSRAFRSVHGIVPSQARMPGVPVKSYPRIRFSIIVKGDKPMEYRIEERPAFRIVGYKTRLRFDVEENFRAVPLFWQEVHKKNGIERLCALMEQTGGPMGVLGVCGCQEGENFDYFCAVASNRAPEADMAAYEVPVGTWAIFSCVGPMPGSVQALQRRIVTDWLPSSGYEYADLPDIEVYFAGDMSAPDYKSEVWLPVRKKD